MEDSNSSEMHSEENTIPLEKSTKRILKTPAQIIALEKFYIDNNYPTEEMKGELAKDIGLTEKQISSWFCHRRLKDKRSSKDEICAIARQDRSSGIMQDLPSVIRQDSCGSTKQSDYRRFDPKEVQSQRLYGHNISVDDDTSSESSSFLQDQIKPNEAVTVRPSIPKGDGKMTYKPSGCLKVKGEIGNSAIIAVKRQLGKHYREDGPLLGVEFETLPPGAFESLSKDPLNGGAFYVGELGRMNSDACGGRKQSRIGNVNKFSFTFY